MRFIRTTIAMLVISSSLAIEACNEEYKIAEVREGFVHFSFEYPAIYDEPRIVIGRGENDTVVYIIRGAETLPNAEGNIVLQVMADSPKIAESGRNAEYWYEASLEWRSSQNVHIIEQTTIKKGTIRGKSLTFSRLDYLHTETPTTVIETQIFFDKNGVTFMVHSVAEESISRQAKADLNHLLRTFKILD